MRPVYQTLTGPGGDCFRACVCSVLEMDADVVPHFCIAEGNWFKVFQDWLVMRNLFALELGVKGSPLTSLPVQPLPPEAAVILSGPSPYTPDCLHSVVGHFIEKDGMVGWELVHDPHPRSLYLAGPPEILTVIGCIRPYNVAKACRRYLRRPDPPHGRRRPIPPTARELL